MDMNAIRFADYRTMTIYHPVSGEPLTHEGEAMTITVCGTESPRYKRAFSRARIEHMGKIRDLVKKRDEAVLKAVKDEVANEIDDLTDAALIETMAGIVVGWNVFFAGEWRRDAPNEQGFVVQALTDLSWLRSQIDTFTATRANFFGPSDET